MARQPWQRLGELIPSVLGMWKRQTVSRIHEVMEAWGTIIGERVATHATPVAVDEGVLLVQVDSAVWAAELSQFHAEKILQEINKKLGPPEIRAVRFICRSSSRRVT